MFNTRVQSLKYFLQSKINKKNVRRQLLFTPSPWCMFKAIKHALVGGKFTRSRQLWYNTAPGWWRHMGKTQMKLHHAWHIWRFAFLKQSFYLNIDCWLPSKEKPVQIGPSAYIIMENTPSMWMSAANAQIIYISINRTTCFIWQTYMYKGRLNSASAGLMSAGLIRIVHS